jgi:Rad3-related DNA helicase
MNLDDYWQENKGFVGQVAAGVLLFAIAHAVIDSTVGGKVDGAQRAAARERQKLAQPAYSAADRDLAAEDNRALTESVASLARRIEFSPSAGFRVPGEPTTSERYLGAVARAREELLPAAGRANVRLDASFGLPELSPTREDELERYLDGLDLVVRVLRIAIDEGVDEVRSIRVRLDSRRGSREGTGSVERTKVEFDLVGHNLALTRLLTRSQTDFDRPLVLDELELESERGSLERARAKVTFLAARLTGDLASTVREASADGGSL